MGFETSLGVVEVAGSSIMKPSLWDLKQDGRLLRPGGVCIMKPSLWDLKQYAPPAMAATAKHHEAIPMGFETKLHRPLNVVSEDHEAIPMGFETELKNQCVSEKTKS